MQTNQNLLQILGVQQGLLDHSEQLQSFCDRQKSKLQSDSFSLSYKKNATMNSKQKVNSSKRKKQNQQLQNMLENSTIYHSNLDTQKKKLFTDISFFSKDHTHDHSIQDQYRELQNKIEFQRSRNKELNFTLNQQKQKIMKKYLQEILEQLKELSDQNKQLRNLYKKQAGGGYKTNRVKNPPSIKIQNVSKNTTDNFHNYTPKNLKTGRRSIANASVCTQNVFQNKSNIMPGKQYFGIGNSNFGPSKKLEMLKQNSKPFHCESSVNIHAGQSLVPSPKKHKRRESQLTERKDYPGKQNNQNDYLLMFDSNSEAQLQNLQSARMSHPSKMPKKRCFDDNTQQNLQNQKIHWAKRPQKGFPNRFTQQNQQSVQSQQDYLLLQNSSNFNNQQPLSDKNIFIQLLQQMLLQQKVQYTQMTQQINQNIPQQQANMIYSYNNVTFIQKVEQQITNKNRKLRQLQQVINVYKLEIEQIMGTDIKVINELMIELLEVKGKYLEMQEKVNGISGLKKEIQEKQKFKQVLIENIKEKMDKKRRQLNSKGQFMKQDQPFQVFPIPQSLKNLFQMLNISLPKNSKPLQYLNEIRNLPNNKQIFQPFDAKKRSMANVKIKTVIDSIRQSRKKFNQVIKIYQGRITKLQQKLAKYKNSQNNQNNRTQKQRIDTNQKHKNMQRDKM